MNLLLIGKRIPNQEYIIQLLFMHIYCRDLMIIIGCIVIDSFIRVTAGGVDRCFTLLFSNHTATSGLINRSQNMKKLTNTF